MTSRLLDLGGGGCERASEVSTDSEGPGERVIPHISAAGTARRSSRKGKSPVHLLQFQSPATLLAEVTVIHSTSRCHLAASKFARSLDLVNIHQLMRYRLLAWPFVCCTFACSANLHAAVSIRRFVPFAECVLIFRASALSCELVTFGVLLRVSAAVTRSDQRFLYVYRFGNSCDEPPAGSGKLPSSTSSLNHLHSTDDRASVATARYPQGARRSGSSSQRPGACGGSAVLGIYIVASLANCFSFLFTVLFGVVSLTVTDDLQRIADVIDELQVCIYGQFIAC